MHQWMTNLCQETRDKMQCHWIHLVTVANINFHRPGNSIIEQMAFLCHQPTEWVKCDNWAVNIVSFHESLSQPVGDPVSRINDSFVPALIIWVMSRPWKWWQGYTLTDQVIQRQRGRAYVASFHETVKLNRQQLIFAIIHRHHQAFRIGAMAKVSMSHLYLAVSVHLRM